MISKLGKCFGKNTTLFTKVCVAICLASIAILFFLSNTRIFAQLFELVFSYVAYIVISLVILFLIIFAIDGLCKLFSKEEHEDVELLDPEKAYKEIVPSSLSEIQRGELKIFTDSITRYLNGKYAYSNWKYAKVNEYVYADLVKYGRTQIQIFGMQNSKAIAVVHMKDALTVLDICIESGTVCDLKSLKSAETKTVQKVKPTPIQKVKSTPVKKQKTKPKSVQRQKTKSTSIKKQETKSIKKEVIKPTPVKNAPVQNNPEVKTPTSNILSNNNVIIVDGKPQIRPNYEMAAKDWVSANMRYINEVCEASLLSNDYEGEKVVALLKGDKLPKEKETWQFIGKLLRDDYNEIDRFSVSDEGITIEID